MTTPVQIACNAVVAKLFNADRQAKNIVSELLSFSVEGAEFMNAFKSGSWNGRSSFFSYETCSFPAGFAIGVEEALKKAGYTVHIVKKRSLEPLGPENPIVDEFGNDDERYDYQIKALRAVEKHNRGIIQAATGSGKSKIAKLVATRYRRPTLFITTRGVLMYQMKAGFEEAGLNVGILGDGEWKPVKGVNVAMVQTLISRVQEPDIHAEIREVIRQITNKEIELSKNQIRDLAKKRYDEKTIIRAKTLKLLEMFEVVIGEEAHEAGGESYFNILKHCRNADIRVALTATPFMKTNMEDNMRLMAAFGPKLITVTEKDLIEKGILATPYFKFAEYEPHPKLRKSSPWQRAYQLGIVESVGRNDQIVAHAKKAVEHKLSVMILVQRKSHGEHLKKMLKAQGISVEFIRGESDQNARQSALNKLKSGKIQVLIGTTILDVGVDVPAVGMIILAGGGKAEIALRQRIGRGLRAKKGANVCFIVDFRDEVDKSKNAAWMDRNNNYLRDHYRQRRQIILDTPGFAENVLANGEDFNWDLLK